jgi:hypothetical protein
MNFWTARFKAKLLLAKSVGTLQLLATLFSTQRDRAAVREVVPGVIQLWNDSDARFKAKVTSYDYYF